MNLLDSFPVLLVDDEVGEDTAAGRATDRLTDHLRADGMQVITARDLDDAEHVIASTPSLSAILLDWDINHHHPGDGGIAVRETVRRSDLLVRRLRQHNPEIPIFLLADQSAPSTLSPGLLSLVDGYVWKLEDTPTFVAQHIEEARREYLSTIMPPFFRALVQFVEEGRYSWHTPGHSGGTAFLKTPVGAALHTFFGENTLRSDLSVSVGELGSLLEHSGPVGDAEAEAACLFGADRTFFVTNGTSTANKIVFHSCVGAGDVVLVDRNCHKSVMHAIVMTGAIPVYFQPKRNAYGIIGPIPPSEFTAENVAARLQANPLVPSDSDKPKLAVITNSTYDGLCYSVDPVLKALEGTTERVLFDEAWFGYAHFHPLYAGRHAMGAVPTADQAVFSTQSTHKLLTAFSQASMVHLRDPRHVINPAAFEEAFMMHTSTSPQYGIIASLDVAARTMAGPQGTDLVEQAISEAIAFRQGLAQVARASGDEEWNFRVWQPQDVDGGVDWALRDGDAWHGYDGIGDGHALLDPIKVTVLTPGVSPDRGLDEHGIPAAIVSHFLSERGVVVEKTGLYGFLVLFSLGVTKGKSGTLLAELLEFKRLYDTDAPLSEALPRLVSAHPDRYAQMTLRGLADALHAAYRRADLASLSDTMYEQVPVPAVTPADAYRKLVAGEIEMVPAGRLAGHVSAAMIVPYPPGIPVIMPGERFGDKYGALIRYLVANERIDASFPGFETEIHGLQTGPAGTYRVPCIAELA